METLLTMLLGLIMGTGTGKTHPRVDAGMPLNAAAGVLGGLLGGRLLGPPLAGPLADNAWAGAAAGAGIGGALVALAAGVGFQQWRGRQSGGHGPE